MNSSSPEGPVQEAEPLDPSYKWKAFTAVAISFFTMVMSISAVFVALSAIADDFGVTLREVTWVVIVQALTISSLMMPMGRLADTIGRKKVHLAGLVVFAAGAAATALAPTFSLLILARIFMAVGNAMGQAVGTAMVISVFPPEERGKAIGAQTTAVAIGGASGPLVAGLVLQWFSWEVLFWMLIPPIAVAFVAGYRILDEAQVGQESKTRQPFDWGGAVLSALGVIALVLTINNPLALSWGSPVILVGGVVSVGLLFGFVRWELRAVAPMMDMRLFSNPVFSKATISRLFGFMAMTAVRFLVPILLISLRGMGPGPAGAVVFLISLGMGVAAQGSGRLSDRFGSRPFSVLGFAILLVTVVSLGFVTVETPIWIISVILLVNGLAFGCWNVPNNSMIMGTVSRAQYGVVGAFTNLTRNGGNVFGQAVAAAVVAGVMTSRGFDIPLSDVADTVGASAAFMDGWRAAYVLVAGFSLVALLLAILTKVPVAESESESESQSEVAPNPEVDSEVDPEREIEPAPTRST